MCSASFPFYLFDLMLPDIDISRPFYLSRPGPCPYLADQTERKLFTPLPPSDEEERAALNAALCHAGFRRSQSIAYRPACLSCAACLPVRIPVTRFAPSRSLRRIRARNADLQLEKHPPRFTPELFALFLAYQKSRHAESDMTQMSETDFREMLEVGGAHTELYVLRDHTGVLQGCLIADDVGDGTSAVYSFFAVDAPRRSLGTALILSVIEDARTRGLAYVYLGYWIAASRKMAYKSRFQPLESLGSSGWNPVVS